MTIRILSDDKFLTLGIIILFGSFPNKKYHFIDIDRVKNYVSTFTYINDISADEYIVFILRGGINSRPLEQYGGLSIDAPLSRWRDIPPVLFRRSKEEWGILLKDYISGENLTNKQKTIKLCFENTLCIKEVAQSLRLSEKTVRSNLEKMYKKYNLLRFRDFMFFITNN